MNSEQLQEWLTELNCLTKDEMVRLEAPEACAHFLQDNGESTEILMDYLARNYADQDLTEPIFGQILSGYYRGGWSLLYLLRNLFILLQYCRRSASICSAVTADADRDVFDRRVEAPTSVGGDAGDAVHGDVQRGDLGGSAGLRFDREATGRGAHPFVARAEHLSRSGEDQSVRAGRQRVAQPTERP